MVSVVVPLYNKGPYIRRCLESIRRQTVSDFEAVIVDDGSTDGGGEAAAAFGDDRFRVVVQENRGSGAARNRGLAETSAEVIAFLDADDTWEPGFLDAIVQLEGRYPCAGLYATGYRCCSGTQLDRETTILTHGESSRLIPDYLWAARRGNIISSSSVAIRRGVLDKVGLFLESTPFGEDREFWLRIALQYPVAYDPRILASYRMDACGRVCAQSGRPRTAPPAVATLRVLLAQGSLQAFQTRAAKAYIDSQLLGPAYDAMYRGDRDTALEMLRPERFMRRASRVKVRLLRAAVRVTSPRVVAALRIRPALLLSRARGMPLVGRAVSAAGRWRGEIVVTRLVRARAREGGREVATAPLRSRL